MKVGYLTIDDAPSPAFSDTLEALRTRDVRAIIFCSGQHLEVRMDQAVQALQTGHILGNHSYSHPRFSQITMAQAQDEIRRTEELLEVAYRRAGVEKRYCLFRFPFGDRGKNLEADLLRYLRMTGYVAPAFEGIAYDWYQKQIASRPDTSWTLNLRDWKEEYRDLSTLFASLSARRAEHGDIYESDSNEIILAHDLEGTPGRLGRILNWFKAHGYELRLPPLVPSNI